MSKPASKPSVETELVVTGQPSDALLAKLKLAGSKVTDDQVLASFARSEDAKTRFHHAAVETGILLLAKKQSLKFGQWGKWCEALVAKSATRGGFDGAVESVRTIQRYAFIAQHFLADLEQSAEQFQITDPKLPRQIDPSQVLALNTLPELQREAVSRQIFHWVRGRSLREMLTDLSRADDAARDEENAAKDPNHHKSVKSRQAAMDADSVKPPVDLDGVQLEFWQDVALPLHQLDTFLADDEGHLGTTKPLWQAVVMSLETRLKLARERLNKIA